MVELLTRLFENNQLTNQLINKLTIIRIPVPSERQNCG